MKRIFLLLAALGCACFAEAREQWIAGFVYVTGTTGGIPFASVWLLDPKTEEPEYGALTSVNGWYDLGDIETDRFYILKVTAPGCETITKKIKVDYVEIEGNRTCHIPIIRSQNAGMLMPAGIFKSAEIAPDAKTIEDIYPHIPGIIYEEGCFTDENGANICFMFNGYIPNRPSYDYLVNYFTAKDVISIEYYNIVNTDTPFYDGVISFVIKGMKLNVPKITRRLSPAWDL